MTIKEFNKSVKNVAFKVTGNERLERQMRTVIIVLLITLALSGCSYRGIHDNTVLNYSEGVEEVVTQTEEPITNETTEKSIPLSTLTPSPSVTPEYTSSSESVEVAHQESPESSWPPEKTETYVITYTQTTDTASWPPKKRSSSAGMLYEYGVRYEAKVDEVVDGDTFIALMPDGSKEYIRFLGITTPETIPTENSPEEYENITNLDCIAEWGEKAKQFAASMLENQNVSIEFDSLAGMTDYSGRFIAYVYLQDDDFAEVLIQQGYARVYEDAEYAKKSTYLNYQKEAIESNTGLWGCRETQTSEGRTKSPIIILEVHYDAEGDDNTNLNDEYIVLKNIGNEEVNLQGWYVEDVSMNKFYFPDILIQPGSTLTLHSGIGINMADHLYWGSGSEIWDNTHDTVYLYNLSGYLVDYYTW